MQVEDGSRLAVDVGGTFIDYVLLDQTTGEVVVDKEPAFADEVAERLFIGFDRLTSRSDVTVDRLIHGSTLALNTILQERGAHVGLLTTSGFRDVLEIGRGNRVDIYDLLYSPPAPLVPRALRREVTERLDAQGQVVTPLDLDDLERQADVLLGQGVEAIALCFLHAYANPVHEQQARDWLTARYPDVVVSCSHEVATEWREFERTSSVVLNTYVMPTAGRYFAEIESELERRSFAGDLAVMQSNGGVMPSEVATQVPLRTLESGPAGGAVGAQVLAGVLGEPNLICADVGGTSFDVALIREGRATERFRTDLAGRPVLCPTVDIHSIGAGGGSIAWIDDRRSLRVGPESAGSRPGPVCFAFGGTRPTVTDCNLVLGRLDADNFLGRNMRLDLAAAEAAIGALAEGLGMDMLQAAGGVIRIAEMDMVNAIRLMTVERGEDPRSFALLPYGGGGGLFASALIEELDIPRAIVPANAAVFSAWGLLFADYREDASLTRVLAVNSETESEFAELVSMLVEQARTKLAAHGIDAAAAELTAQADVRFVGQAHTLGVALRLGQSPEALAADLKEGFVDCHLARYGQADASRDVEVVTVRASAVGRIPHPRLEAVETTETSVQPVSSRPVWFSSAGSMVETEVWSRPDLAPGVRVTGPAVIEEWNTTILVNPGQVAEIDGFKNVIISRSDERGGR
jgi:N-methylhydantoinase A